MRERAESWSAAGGEALIGMRTAAEGSPGRRRRAAASPARAACRVDAGGRPRGPEEVWDGLHPQFLLNADVRQVKDKESPLGTPPWWPDAQAQVT